MSVVHTTEGSANIVKRGTHQTGKRRDGWRFTRPDDFVVNEKTDGRILEHGGNLTGEENASQATRTLGVTYIRLTIAFTLLTTRTISD